MPSELASCPVTQSVSHLFNQLCCQPVSPSLNQYLSLIQRVSQPVFFLLKSISRAASLSVTHPDFYLCPQPVCLLFRQTNQLVTLSAIH